MFLLIFVLLRLLHSIYWEAFLNVVVSFIYFVYLFIFIVCILVLVYIANQKIEIGETSVQRPERMPLQMFQIRQKSTKQIATKKKKK